MTHFRCLNIIQIDRYLYGHPKHIPFNSINDFYPHLKWLSQGREGECGCRVCGIAAKSGSKSTLATKKPSQVKALSMRSRPVMTKGLVDDEGLPDTVPKFLTLLEKERTLDRAIEERYSMVSLLCCMFNGTTKVLSGLACREYCQ